jgi:hypothetical protein
MSRRTLRTDESGVSLILVLVTLVVFGLIVPVLGQFGSTNGVSGYVLKGQRFDRYAAEAGMQGAIQWAQGQRQAGRQGTECPALTMDPNSNPDLGANAARTVTIKCAGFDANGLPNATDTIPAYALMARGTAPDAIQVDDGAVRTDGPWWSEGGIDVGTNLDASADYIGAKGQCRGFTASPADCPSNRSEPDPGLTVGVPDVLHVDRPGPQHPCDAVPDGTLTLQPGLHWDSTFLDAIGDGDCGNVTITLAAGGPHVFDFEFFGGGRPDWRMIPASASPPAAVRIESQGWSPGGCASDANAPVVFAGRFRLRLGAGATADLCGATEGSGQRVALAQEIAGHPVTFSDTTPVVPQSWTVDSPRGTFDLPPSSNVVPASLLSTPNCAPNDDNCSGAVTGTLTGDRADGTVTMTVPDPVDQEGAKVDHLHLEITHREDNTGDIASGSVRISGGLPGGFQCDPSDNPLDVDARWHTTPYDCDLTSAELPYFSTGSLEITYEVTLKNQGNGDNVPPRSSRVGIDAVRVSANDADPVSRTSLPQANQPILRVDPQGSVHADGTVYLPSGDVGVDFGSAPSSTFGRGTIVRTMHASNLPTQPDFAPFSLPNGGNYTDRLATFQAYLDPSDPAVLTARVRFCDAHPDGTDRNVSLECRATGTTGGPAQIVAWDPTR